MSLSKYVDNPYAKAALGVGEYIVNEYNARKRQRSGRSTSYASTGRRGMTRYQVAQRHNGVYRGGFNKPRPLKRIRFPCECKDERSDSLTVLPGNSGYVMHTSHPPRYVMRMIGMALVHKYFHDAGWQIESWSDAIGVYTAVNVLQAPGLGLYAWWKDTAEPNSVATLVVAALVSGDTYLDFADKIADGLTGLVTTSSTAFMLTKLQWRATDAAGVSLAGALWNPQEMFVTIAGKSILNLQNRTAAGDVGGALSKDNIYANPLIGKHYVFKGTGTLVRQIGYTSANTSASLVPDSTSGIYRTASNASPNNAPLADTLHQPPHGKFFTNCKGVIQVRLEPGAVKKSVAYHSQTHSLNQWLRACTPYLMVAADVANIQDQAYSFIGQSKMIGVEKLVDIGVANIVLAFERDAIYRSRLFFRPKNFTVATNVAL